MMNRLPKVSRYDIGNIHIDKTGSTYIVDVDTNDEPSWQLLESNDNDRSACEIIVMDNVEDVRLLRKKIPTYTSLIKKHSTKQNHATIIYQNNLFHEKYTDGNLVLSKEKNTQKKVMLRLKDKLVNE